MLRKSMIPLVIAIIFISVFSASCSAKPALQAEGGLKIDNWSSALGGVDETDLDKTKFTYSVSLTSRNENTVLVKSIVPLVNDSIANKILGNDMTVVVNKEIKPNETIQISGEIVVDTKGLTKADIAKLEPFITDINVSSEETIHLKQ